MTERIEALLPSIYSRDIANHISQQLRTRLEKFQAQYPLLSRKTETRVTERDAILITYGDMLQSAEEGPLKVLKTFLDKRLRDVVSTIHLLPFYPYSSDDGFSVIDYTSVDEKLGGWDDIVGLGQHFRLMFDAVINHISAASEWFRGFLAGEEKYQDYFIVAEARSDLSGVFRPRALPLLTPVMTASGRRLVWTTFSADQIDLNFRNPDVLLAIIDVILFYISKGAEFIRLDAIAFLWKDAGTNCLHLPQTHQLIQLFRAILDEIAPGVSLITETNVPHNENITYFGNGFNEAQMVYNFSLPPLTIHTFHTGNAVHLTKWASTLELPTDQVTYFNFTASHDGIGLMPAREILSYDELESMMERVKELGGHISYKTNPDGTESAYELNVNFMDALGEPNEEECIETIIRRFLASQAIMLAFRGVPGIYFHSLVGSRNWNEGVNMTGRYRTINRRKLEYNLLENELDDPDSRRHKLFHRYLHLIRQRASNPAFHPNGGQVILNIHDAIFSLLRTSPDTEQNVLCLHNVSKRTIETPITAGILPVPWPRAWVDILTGRLYEPQDDAFQLTLRIEPYQVLWLAAQA